MNIPTIDANAPTREEIMAHNMKIAKANLASELAKELCQRGHLLQCATPPEDVARFAIAIAETIIETYSLMPDAAGRKRGTHRLITPLHNRIIVQRFETSVDKVGSLFIPDAAKERPNQGDVLAVGPGRRLDSGERIPVEVKVGDKILFGKYSGTDVKVDGRELLIVREDEILGIIE